MIVREVKIANYVCIENATLRDERLSWKARGLLAYLLSMPDNWQTSIEHLSKQAPDGESSVRSGLKELEGAGYLSRAVVKDDLGKIVRWDTIVHERPQTRRSEPVGDYPQLDEPRVDNPALRSTQEKNDQREEETLFPADAGPVVPAVLAVTDAEFEAWWSVYPRKEGKGAARKSYIKARKKASPEQLLDGAARYAADPNRVPQFTKHPSTWLNGECWCDAPLPSRTGLDRARARQDSNEAAIAAALANRPRSTALEVTSRER